MGRCGSPSPARLRRTASETACSASSCPTTRWRSRSSMCSSFSRSPSSSRETGMPVHLATTSAISSGVTSSLVRPPVGCQLGQLLLLARRAPPAGRAARRTGCGRPSPGRPLRWACSSSVRLASICSLEALDLLEHRPARSASGRAAGRTRLCSSASCFSSVASRSLAGRVLLLAQGLALDLQLHDPAAELVQLGRHGVVLDPQPAGGLVDQVDGLVGQEAVGDVAVAQRRPPPRGPRPESARRGGPRSGA